jgi:hypothetical protein
LYLFVIFFVCLGMEEEDVGRGRHGRDSSRAHASARSKGAAPAPKRGRDRHGQSLVQGTHDAEAGGSGGSRSRAQSRLGQPHGDVPAAQPDFDANQYINYRAEYAEDQQPPHHQPEPQQAPPEVIVQPPQNVQEQVYGGGPRDLSLLSEYHKHRAIPIWDANPNDHAVNITLLRVFH